MTTEAVTSAEASPSVERVVITDEEWADLVRTTRARKAYEKSEFRLRCEETYREYGCRVPLPNVTEMTVQEFARSGFFSQCIAGRIYRSDVPDPSNPGKTITIMGWWYEDGTWIGLSRDYWVGTVRYWRGCLCDHQYRGLPQRWNCYHESICVKCGHYDAYDSGD